MAHSNLDIPLGIPRQAAYAAILLSWLIMSLLRACSASSQELLVRFPVGFASTGVRGERGTATQVKALKKFSPFWCPFWLKKGVQK